jgi:long-subunit fatty acid transport protein
MERLRVATTTAAIALLASSIAAAQSVDPQDELTLGRFSLVVGAGARAFGMGGAFLARADDATAASWNPAGLSYLRRPEATFAGAHEINKSDITSATGVTTEFNRFEGTTPDFAALTYPLEIGSVSGAAQISFQRVIPWGGAREIGRAFPEPDVSIDATGGFDTIALGTGWRVSRRWRLGVTLNRWFNGFQQDLQRKPDPALVERTRQIITTFDIEGWNFNLGLMWSPVESLNVGLVGRTPFTANVRLAKERTDFFPDEKGELVPVGINSHESDDVRLDFPGAVGAGASWRPRSQLTVSADYTRTFWSDAFIYNYFLLPFAPIESEKTQGVEVFPRLPFPFLTEEQVDAQQIRTGFEYVWITSRLKVPLRLGYFTDRQIARSEDGSIPWLHGVTAGTGIIAGPILFDLAYLYESGSYVDITGARQHLRSSRFLASFIYRHRGLP